MQKLLFTVLPSMLFIGCTSSSYPIHNIPPKNTVVKEEPKTEKEFKKDHHRYDNRYRNFDYNRLGYSSDNGLYYGYFDDMGYFYNNIYFIYNDEYTYEDRYHRRGHFSPHVEHMRVYHPQEFGPSYQNSEENRKNR